VEFAVEDGVPYAIDFMNPAPDADLHSVGEFYHNWVTSAVTNLVFKRLGEAREQPRYRWDALLNPAPVSEPMMAAAAAADVKKGGGPPPNLRKSTTKKPATARTRK
jgi:hypothetical protein